MNDKEINIALGKLFKDVSLKGERVELSIVDDAKKALKELGDFWQSQKKEIDEAYTHIRTMEKAASEARGYTSSLKTNAVKFRKLEDNVEEHIDKARKAAKDLGIKLDPKDIVDYSKYNTLIKLSLGYQNDVNLYLKFMKSLPKFNL